MADHKKFIIIEQDEILSSKSGKRRVRVYQDDPDEINKVTEATEKQTEATEKNTEAEKENAKAKEISAKATELSIKQTEELLGVLDKQLRQYAQADDAIGKYARAQSDILTLERELTRAQAEGIEAKEEIIKAQLEQAVATRDQIGLSIESAEAAEGASKAEKELIEQNKLQLKGLKQLGSNMEKINKSYLEAQKGVDQYTEKLEVLNDTTRPTGFALQGMSTALSAAGLSSLDFSDSAMSVTKALGGSIMKFQASNIELERNTNLGKAAADSAFGLVQGNTSLGLSTEEAVKAITSLNNGMSGFVALSQEAQQEIGQTVVEMERLGVSSEASAKAIDLLDRSMGMSATGAAEALKDFDKLGQELALPTGQLVEDFTKLGPKLARFGKDGKKQFEMLAKEARKLGVEVGAAFDVAEAFDTFEGAADMAGKLNAQLGLQINSVEMLGATHSERIELLRQEFAQSGQNFDQLNRRQKQAVAEMMGIDVDMASKLFGDPVEYEKTMRKQEEAEERAKRLSKISDQLATIGDRIAAMFQPVLNVIVPVVKGLAYLIANPLVGTLIATLTAGIGIYKTYLTLRKGLEALDSVAIPKLQVMLGLKQAENTQQQVSNGLQGQGIGLAAGKANADGAAGLQAEFRAKAEEDLADGIEKSNDATEKGGKTAADAAIGMLALGAAIMMIGTGIGIAALGLAQLVEAFQGLSNAGPALLALVIVMGGFVAMVYILATASSIAAGPIGLLGLAFLGIGAGIFLAAYGMSLLVKAIGGLSEHATVVAEAFGSIVTSLIQLAPYALLVGFSMAIIAKSVIVAIPALFTLGAVLVGIAGSFLLASFMAGRFASAMERISDATVSISANTEGLQAIAEVVKVDTEVGPLGLGALDSVMEKVVNVMVESRTANVPALQALASAVNPAAGAGAGGGAPAGGARQEKTVQLVLNERVFGEVIVDLLDDKYDLTAV